MDHLETMVDRLSEVISKHREIPAEDAAHILKIKQPRIEEWARALEKQGFIAIEYSPMHGMILKSRQLTPEEKIVKVERLGETQKSLLSSAVKLETGLKEQENRIPELEKGFVEIEADVTQKLHQATRALGMLRDLEGIENIYSGEIRQVEAAEKKAAITAKQLDARKEQAQKMLQSSRESLSGMRARLRYAHTQISQMRKQVHKIFREKAKLDKSLRKFEIEVKMFERHTKGPQSEKAVKEYRRLSAKAEKLQTKRESFMSSITVLQSNFGKLHKKHAAHEKLHQVALKSTKSSKPKRFSLFRRKKGK